MVMVVKPLFTLENATFWSFWLRAGLAPQPFIFCVWNIGSCVLSFSRATKWPPYELILSISKFTYGIYGYTVYIRSYTANIRYMEIPYTVWANPKHVVCLRNAAGQREVVGCTQQLTHVTRNSLAWHTNTNTHTHSLTHARTHTWVCTIGIKPGTSPAPRKC